MNQELKVLLKEHKGILQLITVKNMKTGAHNSLGLLKIYERKLKKIWKNGVLRLEVLHLTTRLKLQNGI